MDSILQFFSGVSLGEIAGATLALVIALKKFIQVFVPDDKEDSNKVIKGLNKTQKVLEKLT